MSPKITKIFGPKPGRTLAVFAGVHGNELAGIKALNNLEERLALSAGTVYLVLANIKAIEEETRYIEKNLNRCFIKGNSGSTYEDGLARELMDLLDQCDALLDLHGYNGPEDQPFLICEPNALELASKLNFSIVSSGWTSCSPGGADGYMFSKGKMGICAECGSNLRPEDYVALAEQTVLQFLQYFELIEETVPLSSVSQSNVTAVQVVKRTKEDFAFTKNFRNFEKLEPGVVFAHDGDQYYRADVGQCIIFPRPNAQIGEEVFTIGKIT